MLDRYPSDLDRKSFSKLRKNVQKISEGMDADLLPPSVQEEIYDMPLREIRTHFRRRYDAFLKTSKLNLRKKGAHFELMREGIFIRALNSLDEYISRHEREPESRTLRDAQFEAFKHLRDYLESGGKSGYFKLPTSYGKSVLFTEFIEALGLKTLVVVPTIVLISQMADKMKEFGENLDVGLVYGYAKSHGHQVTITTYSSFVRGVGSGSLKPDDFDCVIFDEAHRTLGGRVPDVVPQFDHAIKIGFTATPFYHDDKQLSQILPEEILTYEMKDAVAEGLLCPVRNIVAFTDTDMEQVAVRGGGAYEEKDLEKAINVDRRNTAIVELYLKLFEGKTGVAYCGGIKHAKKLAKTFEKMGVSADFIAGYMGKKEKKRLLADHHNGKIKVLCNADLLIEGYDEPKIEVCLNAGPTFSQLRAEQRGGRCTRLDPDNKHKFATVVDFVDKDVQGFNLNVLFAEVLKAPIALRQGQKFDDDFSGVDLNIDGLKVITDPENIMEVVKERRLKRELRGEDHKLHLEGWRSATYLSDVLNVSLQLVQTVAIPLRARRPELFLERPYGVNLRDEKDRKFRSYYHEEVVALFKAELEELRPPEGWITRDEVLFEYGVREDHLKSFLLSTRGVWKGTYLGPSGRMRIYYNPDIVGEIKRRVLDEYPGDDWLDERSLSERLRVPEKFLSEVVNKMSINPDMDLVKARRTYESPLLVYVSPELMGKVTEYIYTKSEYYLTAGQVADALNIESEQLDELVKKGLLGNLLICVDDFGNVAHRNDMPKILRVLVPQFVEWPSFEECARKWGLSEKFILKFIHDNVFSKEFKGLVPDASGKIVYKKNELEGKISLYINPVYAEEIETIIKDFRPPKGWMSSRKMSKELGISIDWVRLILRRFKKRREAEVKKYQDQDGRFKPHYSPEMTKEVQRECKDIESWPSLMDVCKQLDCMPVRVRAMVDRINRRPEINHQAVCVKANVVRVSPMLIPILREQMQAVEGWVTMRDIMRATGIEYPYLRFLLREITRENAPLVRYGFTEEGERKLFMDPSIIRLVRSELIKIRFWKKSQALAEELKLTLPQMDGVIDYYKRQNPFLSCTFRSSGKRDVLRNVSMVTLVSPAMEQMIGDLVSVPAGFVSYRTLSERLNMPEDDLLQRVEAMREEKSDQFKDGWDYIKREKIMLIGPEVLRLLKGVVLNPVPEGWMSMEQMVTDFGVDADEISELIEDSFGLNLGDKAGEYINDNGDAVFYYSDRVVNTIKTKLPAPTGWMDYPSLAENLGVGPREVKACADRLSEGNAEWVCKFYCVERKGQSTFLHPELVALINNELG